MCSVVVGGRAGVHSKVGLADIVDGEDVPGAAAALLQTVALFDGFVIVVEPRDVRSGLGVNDTHQLDVVALRHRQYRLVYLHFRLIC